MNYLIKNATLVNEGKTFEASVYVKDGIIAEILNPEDEKSYPSTEIIHAKGLHLFPGIIDTHVHFREPGLTHKADMTSESRAAVAGGITSFLDMPNTIPQTTTNALIDEKIELASGKSLANFGFFIGASNSNIDEIASIDIRKIPGIKVFLGSSTGNMMIEESGTLYKLFQSSPTLLVAHCEDESIIKGKTNFYKEKYGDSAPAYIHPLIRNEEACYRSSAEAIELANKTNARLHIAHLSTKKELDLLEDKPLSSKKITAEACVHHLWFDDEDYATLHNLIKCNPAIKSGENKNALRKSVCTNKIDFIATDHAPHAREEKQQPYFLAPSGIPFIQHSLVCMLEMYKKGIFSLECIIEKMAHNPALLFNIQKRGFIRKGYHADLVLVDLNNPWTVSKDNILYKCNWSPLEDRTFHSKIVTTFVNGNVVFNNGELFSMHKGTALNFQPMKTL